MNHIIFIILIISGIFFYIVKISNKIYCNIFFEEYAEILTGNSNLI